jgi:ABC-type lipoprotein release transport system permease subunit
MAFSTPALQVAWYRFRRTFRHQWTGYLALALLIGLVGGLAIASVAAARRTQAAFPAYLAHTSPSDLTVLTGISAGPGGPGYDPALIARIAALPGVRHVASYAGLNVAILGPDGTAHPTPDQQLGPLPASIDGEYFTTDRVTVVAGRMADPARPDEIVIDARGTPAQVRVGDVASLGFFTNAQLTRLESGNANVTPSLRLTVHVVGKVLYSFEEAQDDIDTQRNGGALFTPALARRLAGCCAGYTETAIQLRPGTSVAAAEAAIQRVLPRGFPVEFTVTGLTTTRAQRGIAPTVIALAIFGGIAGVAALVIAGQVIARQLRQRAGDLAVLRALGASPGATTCDGLPGIGCAIVAGSLLAAAVAVAASPVAPLGSVRAVYPYPGIAVDWAALGAGAGLLIAVLSLIAATLAWRQAPHRGTRSPATAGLAARFVRAARACGLPAPATEGIRLALEPAADRSAVPLRSVIAGTVLAAAVTVATVTFGASLSALVSHPALYGWNWTFDVSSGSTGGSLARARVAAALDRDPAVAAWTGVYYGAARIDGQTVPLIGMSPGAPIAPPVLSGHALAGPGQVVLGASTLAQLGKRVGDTVTVQSPGGRASSLRVVGTATLPSLGVAGTLHTEMGTGAVVPFQVIPEAAEDRPNEVLVTLRPGAAAAAARARLQRLVPAAEGGVVIGVQRPAEIVNYGSMGTAPAILSGTLAAGAVTSLWLTLMASVRRRRRDLAILKTVGFTRRQLAATVTWQSLTAVTAGVAAGVPAGVALGRALWQLFATQIDVVPYPAVPLRAVALVIVGALALAGLVALIPGRAAGRIPAATLLHAE